MNLRGLRLTHLARTKELTFSLEVYALRKMYCSCITCVLYASQTISFLHGFFPLLLSLLFRLCGARNYRQAARYWWLALLSLSLAVPKK